MSAKMEKKTVIFPKDYATKETKLSLFEISDEKDVKAVTLWKDMEEALAVDLGIGVELAKAKKAVAENAKKPEFTDPYVKIGVAGADLVFRIKQSRHILRGGDIEVDTVLVKGYDAQKKKKAEQWPFRLEPAVLVIRKTPALEKDFREQLKKEFSTENLDFLDQVEEIKDAKGQLLETLKKSAYLEFIPEKSPKEINISSATRLKLKAFADKGAYKEMNFSEAEDEIIRLIDRDSYPRFKPTLIKKLGIPDDCTVLGYSTKAQH